MHEATVVESELNQSPQPVGSVEGKPGVTVITSKNREAYVNEQIGTPEPTNPDPEQIGAEEAAVLDAKKAEIKAAETAPKEGDKDGSKVYFKGEWVDKHNFGYRVHLKAEEVRKEEQAKFEAKETEAKTLREEREALARERDELKAKYEPPKSDELGPEPLPTQFTDVTEYSKALKDWTAESTRKADAAARAQAASETRWKEAEKALQAEIPDYAERLAKAPASAVNISNELRDAIFDSDIGPKLRLHLAENPEVVRELSAMTIGQMLKRVGRIEASLTTGGKEQSTPAAKLAAVVELSKAPAPITPIKGGAGVLDVKVDDSDGKRKYHGSYEDYKRDRAKLLQR